MKLSIKFHRLTNDQRAQVKSFYKDDIDNKKIILNQMSFSVNSSNGRVMFFKDM